MKPERHAPSRCRRHPSSANASITRYRCWGSNAARSAASAAFCRKLLRVSTNPFSALDFNKEQTPLPRGRQDCNVLNCRNFMSELLNKTIVLVLNRNWQAINIRTPQDAFCQMATNVATALEIDGENSIRPVMWDEWITLPVREGDHAVRTARGPIRVPTVIVAVNYARVPKKRPKLS